jgi:hypothetical protein
MPDEEGFIEKSTTVKSFLQELNLILSHPKCDIIIPNRDDKPYKFTNEYCLSILDFDIEDVKKELKSLKIENYLRTKKDENNKKYNEYYYEFGKNIQNKKVYIKVKIVSRDNKQVLCISFHFPEYEMKFPYKY